MERFNLACNYVSKAALAEQLWHVDKKNRNEFVCLHCGLAAAADINAARNIRARASGDAPNGSDSKAASAEDSRNFLVLSKG
jgi:transposase